MASTNRSRAGALVLLSATFLVGLAAGVTLDRVALARQERLVPPRGGVVAERVVRRLDRELDLSPAQQEQIRAILDRRRQAVEQLRRELRPRIAEEIQAASVEIEGVLTPEQQSHFRQLRERMRRRWERRSSGARP